MVSQVEDANSKQFNPPPRNVAGIYIYRDSGWAGKTQVKEVWLDGQLLGSLASETYFYLEVAPGAHTLSTQATADQNELRFNVGGGRSYYFSQVLSRKVPVVGAVVSPFVSAVTFEAAGEQEGQATVLRCRQAVLKLGTTGAVATTQPDCVSALDADPELQAISWKVALSGNEDNLSTLLAINERPTPSEQKVIAKWGSKRERCFKANPPSRDAFYQLSVDTFNLGQQLIQDLSKGGMTYGQFTAKRRDIKQASLAKAKLLQTK